MRIIYLCLIFFSLNTYADQKINLNRSLIDRQVKNFSVLANYSYFDLWIPSKYGLSLSITPNSRASYDIEYLKGELSLAWFIDDLGSFSDERLSILRRSFSGRNSFNFILGAYYSKTLINLSSELLANAGSGYDLLSVENLGITLGVGNRWVLKNGLTIGADWISVNIPVYNLKTEDAFTSATTDDDDRDLANDAIDIFKNIPGVVALKIQLGFSF